MINIYVKRIRRGEMALEEVPEKWRAAVAAIIEGE